jgi:hypothetical protein
MQLLSNNSKEIEWKNSIEWVSNEKQKVISAHTKPGQKFVNQEMIIEEHLEGKRDRMSEALARAAGVFKE